MKEPEEGEQQPRDPEVERLRKELARAKLAAEIAAERRKAVTDLLPTPEAKPVEGKTTVDAAVTIETEILAYRRLQEAANRIAASVITHTPAGRSVLIHEADDMAALAAFRSFLGQMAELRTGYDDITPPTPRTPAEAAIAGAGLAIVAATGVVRTVIDLIGLFGTDRNVAGVPIAITDVALIAEVTGVLSRQDRNVFVTALYPLHGDARHIQRPLDDVRRSALAARERAARIADAAEKAKADERLQQLDAIRRSYDDSLVRLATEGPSALATLLRGAALFELVQSGKGLNVLYLKVLKAAGSNRTRRGNFGSSSLTHSGGVIVTFVLFDATGRVLASNTLDSYSGASESVPVGNSVRAN